MPPRDELLSRLFVRIADGDAGAMQELFLQERSSLHRLFLGLGRCASLAEDLVQGTFLSLWRYRRNWTGRGSPSAYLYSIAMNQWRASHAREARRRDAWRDLLSEWREAAGGDASEEVERRETLQRIWGAIDALPAEQREVFLLHRYHELSCPEIAAATEAKVKTVESRLRLALEKLTARLQPRLEWR